MTLAAVCWAAAEQHVHTAAEAALAPCRAALLDVREWMQGAASVSLMAVASAVKRQAARKALRCTHPGCGSVDVGRGFCRKHGGGKRCTVPGCGKTDIGGGLCSGHGGGRRRVTLHYY
eukprot:13946-Heterococcus_DN1.PRE.1